KYTDILPRLTCFLSLTNTLPTVLSALSLHDALPISEQVAAAEQAVTLAQRELEMARDRFRAGVGDNVEVVTARRRSRTRAAPRRSEEHTSELQSQSNLVCRLLHEKKN